jgi:hypothetical protein
MAKATQEHHGALAPAARSASVAINVGPGRGALVLYPSERCRGREIEISRADGDARRVHTGVHDRTTHERSLLAAIFGSLPAGDYVVWKDATTRGPVVTVPEGAVAESRIG